METGTEEITVFTRSVSEAFIEHGADGPVCLVGSKNYGITVEEAAKKRVGTLKCFRNRECIGLDIEAGVNVDVVADICSPELFAKQPGLRGYFGFVQCGALLEHVVNPFDAARNIQELLKPGGHLYFNGPWVWGFHAYPGDYWRISMSGVKVLFPQINFREWWYSSTTKNVCIKLADQSLERKYLQEIPATFKKPGGQITDRAMPYLNINAIGVKK